LRTYGTWLSIYISFFNVTLDATVTWLFNSVSRRFMSINLWKGSSLYGTVHQDCVNRQTVFQKSLFQKFKYKLMYFFVSICDVQLLWLFSLINM